MGAAARRRCTSSRWRSPSRSSTLPLSYYSGYVLPHRYGLSTQSRAGWAWDLSKGLAISLVFELVAVVFVYWLLAVSPDWWWLWTVWRRSSSA